MYKSGAKGGDSIGKEGGKEESSSEEEGSEKESCEEEEVEEKGVLERISGSPMQRPRNLFLFTGALERIGSDVLAVCPMSAEKKGMVICRA